MKSKAAKIASKHSSRVSTRKSSRPFFQKSSSAAQGDRKRSASPGKQEGRSGGGELIPLNTPLSSPPKEKITAEQSSLSQTEVEKAPLLAEPPVSSKQGAASSVPEAPAAGPDIAISEPVSLPEPAAALPAQISSALSPAEQSQQFSALPPSAQAETYAGFGPALSSAFGDQAAQTQETVPELSASLAGVAEPMETPAINTPPATSSLAGQALAGAPEPAIVVPDAPVQEPIGHPELPSPQQAEGGGLDEALGTIDPAPEIETSLEPPEIPLEGNADPAALGSLELAAAGEAENLLGSAQASVAEVSPEVVQPLALEETLTAPVLPEVQLSDQAPRVEGMDQLAGYALGPLDRAAFDEQVGPSLQAATAEAQAELVQREQNFSQERTELQLAADAEAVTAQTEAQAKQRLEVDKGRQALATEQQRTLDQQQAAVDGALGELSVSREASAQEIDGRLAADRAAVDEVYAAAEADAQAEVAQGTAQADAAGQSAAEQAEGESWWDWAIDSWQSLVQAVAGKIIAIWEKVAEAVAGFLNRAIALASTIVSAAVAFVKKVLSAYFDLWTRLVDKLLGSLFPELAAAFKAWIDRLKAAVFAALDAVAAAYLQALRFIADKLVAGLYAALELYKAGVNAYLAMWETLQNSSWSDIGKALLSGLLTVVGIDPKEFFATFAKADEVVDDIIADPTLIGKRAVEALSLGIKQFGQNFIGNFTAAFVEWITGAARIIMPKTFSLAGIFDVVCQVLNLTYDYLREKAVQHLGERAVAAVEELFAAIKAFLAEGWAGLWKFVKDKLITLVDDVVIAMGSWLVEKAILVAGRWVAGLIATFGWSALVEGLIALWQFAMWVKDQFQRFWQIVKSTIDSVHEFVKGQIQPAADTIEGTLQDLIIPAIDLVAKLLNLGNIAKKVEQIIESVRQMIDEAIDSMVAFLKKQLGLGGEEEEGEGEEEEEGEGAITLATLNEPPVTLPRTKEEERQDLATAHKVLILAEKKVEDTAELAEYFDAIQKRFRLQSIGFESLSGEALGVEMSINPDEIEPTEKLKARELREGESKRWSGIETDVKFWSQEIRHPNTGQAFKVGKKMEAAPLGPDHPQGTPPGNSHNDLMMHLPTKGSGANRITDQRKRYIKGHLLNDNVGGPGIPDNLFPMIEYVNLQKFEPAIEQWVKDQVKEGYYVYYRVEIAGNKLTVYNQPKYNRVDSVITAEAGYWLSSGEADSARKRASVENKLVGGSEAPEEQESDPARPPEAVRETGIISDPSSRTATPEDPQAALATRNADGAAAAAQEYAQLTERAAAVAADVPELQSARGEVQRWAAQATEAAERAATAAENAHKTKQTDSASTRISAAEAEQEADSARLAEQEAMNVLTRVRQEVVIALRGQLDGVVAEQERIIGDSLTAARQALAGFIDYAARLSATVEQIRATWKLLGKFEEVDQNRNLSKLSSKRTQIEKQTAGLEDHQGQINDEVQRVVLADLARGQAETIRQLEAAGSAAGEGLAAAFVQANLAWSAMLDVSSRIVESTSAINRDVEKRRGQLSQYETTLNGYRDEIKSYIKQQGFSVSELVSFAATSDARLLDSEREAVLKFLSTELP